MDRATNCRWWLRFFSIGITVAQPPVIPTPPLPPKQEVVKKVVVEKPPEDTRTVFDGGPHSNMSDDDLPF